MPLQYTIQIIHYSDGTTTQIAVDAQGLPLVPQPDLSNSTPCPTETPNIDVPTIDISGLATEATLQDVLAAIETPQPCCNELVLSNILTAIEQQNGLLNVWSNAISTLLSNQNNVTATLYKSVHQVLTGANFDIPSNAVSFSCISLEFDPSTLAPYTAIERQGDTLTDPDGGILPLLFIADYRLEETTNPDGTLMPIGTGYQVNAGGSVIIIYKIPQ